MLPQGYNRCWFSKDGIQEWDLEIQQVASPALFDEDEVLVTPARFEGLWDAAGPPRHLVAV